VNNNFVVQNLVSNSNMFTFRMSSPHMHLGIHITLGVKYAEHVILSNFYIVNNN